MDKFVLFDSEYGIFMMNFQGIKEKPFLPKSKK